VTRRVAKPLPWLAGLLTIYLLAPLVAGAQQLGLADWNSVDTDALIQACLISIASATVATVLIAIGGIPLGYVLARIPGRAMAAVSFLVQLPLALPPLTSGILLLFLIGYTAPLGRLFNGALTDSFYGIVLAQVFVAAPFLIVAARSGFAAMDPVLEGVAATLGRRPVQIFLRVSLPIAWPTILAGLLLAWLRAFGEFGATVMVAYHPYSLPVYTYVAFGSQGLPAMMPVLLPTLVLGLVIMALSGTVARKPDWLGGTWLRAIIAPAAVPNGRDSGPPLLVPRGQESFADVNFRLAKDLGDFDLDLDWAPRARRLAILGPSGSGKSLTLQLIAGIERFGQGSVVVDGRELSRLDPWQRNIAYVPQNYGLFPHLTVSEQLRFPVGANAEVATHWIKRLGLQGLEQRRPAALSLGQQQRVALARALNRPARLLLLDEPFSALDAPLRARLRRDFLALQAEVAATTILVTHDPIEAALLADELLVLAEGRVLQCGSVNQVFMRPANERVARLVGADNVASGITADEHGISLGDGVVVRTAGPPLRQGESVGWSFPPARAEISPHGAYCGAVEAVTSAGVGRHVTVRLGNASVRIFDGQTETNPAGQYSFDIDPYSIQVWPLDQVTRNLSSDRMLRRG
jgi:ABC-type Fe3+/spermidine/putrescine transport system ATPase subunit/ABC-type sulfate transport system permease component